MRKLIYPIALLMAFCALPASGIEAGLIFRNRPTPVLNFFKERRPVRKILRRVVSLPVRTVEAAAYGVGNVVSAPVETIRENKPIRTILSRSQVVRSTCGPNGCN